MCLLLDGYFLQRAQIVFSSLRQQGWNTFAGEYAFLTQITHTLQTIFFFLLLVFDLFELFIGRGKKEKRQLQQSGDQPKQQRPGTSHYLHLIGDHGFSVLFVFTAVVGVFFWTLYFLDQDLIMPAAVEHLYPRDVNLFQHGVVLLIMLAELFTTHHRNLSSYSYEMVCVLVAGTLYLVWTLILVQINGRWPYPFQNDMTLMHHVIFYLVSMAFMGIMVFVKRFLIAFWWPNETVIASPPTRRNRPKAD